MIFYAVILLLIIFIVVYNQTLRQIESFDNINIISKLDDSAGFYSQLFFLMNHYIYCKKNKQNFEIDSQQWIYKSKYGWTDYFTPLTLKIYESNKDKVYRHNNTIDEYSIQSYKDVIPEIYVYNERIQQHINIQKRILNLENYDSIYIRRGDKLIDEIKLSQESIYIELLLQKNPNCKTIFLQTDDYTCFKNLQKYIDTNNLNIRLVTTCDENSVGAITSNYYKENLGNSKGENNEYLSSIHSKLQKTKPIEDMNSEEKYAHTLELLTGIDICINSNICVCDFNSNVSRFIKLAHKNTNNVFDINNTIVDFSKKVCPAYSF